MKVLLCGADGFLGRSVTQALVANGHQVLRGVRRPRLAGDVTINYRRDVEAHTWLPRLSRVGAVINAVGIFTEGEAGDFDAIHHRAPAALFDACRQAGIERVVQISALGSAKTPFLESKRLADAALRRLAPSGTVVRPGLVFGHRGTSTQWFLGLASLPIQFLPGGAGYVQPIHIEDVSAIVVRLLEGEAAPAEVELPGPIRLAYADWMTICRRNLLKLPPARILLIPAILITVAARIAGLFRKSPMFIDTWMMLQAGSVGDATAARRLKGAPLIEPKHFLDADDRDSYRLHALSWWRIHFLRGTLAIIWFGTALASAGLYPIRGSLALLTPFGLSGPLAVATLIGATALDFAMGILTLCRPQRSLWQAQLALIAVYTALIAWKLPSFLTHPFGPILKNVAVGALLIQLWAEETES